MDNTQLAEGWPKPPHWYNLFPETGKFDPAQFPPPPIPEGNFTAFGNIIDMSESDNSAALDPDQRMFNEKGVLRDEFARLFELLVSEIVFLFGQSAQVNSEHASGASGRAKNILRIYKNLQHILQMLRQVEFENQMVEKMREQCEHKLALINDIRQIGFDLAPVDLDTVLQKKEAG